MTERRPTGQPPDIWQILMVGPPLIGAFCTPLLGLFWVMGASAFSGSEHAWIYNAGFLAILGYFAVYCVLMVLVAISTAFKWGIESLVHSLIWLSLIVFVSIVAWSFVTLTQ